jgi:exodeoxyribonuclease VII small subunit
MAAENEAAQAGEAGSVEGLTFEEAMDRLESIVEELEGGALTLEQSIARYEMGVKLSQRLTQTLDQAEKKIEKLVEGDDEAPATQPMELELKHPEPGSEGELPF